MAYEVFISHSSKDKTAAEAVCEALEAQRIRCWIAPRDIGLGVRSWPAAILQGIISCRAMVLIFSSHANESEDVGREVERAVSHKVAIVPLRIENVPPAGIIEYFLSSHQWLDAMPPLEHHLNTFAIRMAGMLHPEAGGPALPGKLLASGELQSETAEPVLPNDSANLRAPRSTRDTSKRLRIFISHKSKDLPAANLLKQAFGQYFTNVSYFMAHDLEALRGSDRWQETLHRELDKADWFFLVYTTPDDDWSWCIYEAGYFAGGRRAATNTKMIVLHPPRVVCPPPVRAWQSVKAEPTALLNFFRQILDEGTPRSHSTGLASDL